MWFVYTIVNKTGSYCYIGITQNLSQRLKKHNEGATKSTRPYRPFVKIIPLKKCSTRREARWWERYFKSGIGREKVKQMLKYIRERGVAQLD